MGEDRQCVGYFFKRSLEKAMGKALDYARISGMSDRSFEQFERTVKHDFNRIIEQGLELLVEQDYITSDEAAEVLRR